MIQSVDMWSEAAQAVVAWSVSLESEPDEGGNIHEVLMLRHGDELHRFSPRTTEEELLARLHPETSDLLDLHARYRLQIVPR